MTQYSISNENKITHNS